MSEAQFDEKFISVDEAERLIIETGEWRGTTVEFSDDGVAWADAWLPSDGNPTPKLCRATVTREGVTIPTVVVSSWDEVYPDDDPEAARWWDKKKTVMLSKVTRVSAYRQSFRDVIGKRYERAEFDRMAAEGRREQAREWVAELAGAVTPEQVNALYKEAVTAKAFVGDDELQARFGLALGAVSEVAKPAQPAKPKPQAPSPSTMPPARPQGARPTGKRSRSRAPRT